MDFSVKMFICVCGFAGSCPRFKSGHRQYYESRENTEISMFSLFFCAVEFICTCMYDTRVY